MAFTSSLLFFCIVQKFVPVSRVWQVISKDYVFTYELKNLGVRHVEDENYKKLTL